MKRVNVLAAAVAALWLGSMAWAQDAIDPADRVDPAKVQAILDRVDTLHVTSYREIDASQSVLPAELQAILDDAEQAEGADGELQPAD
jgi:hypothetical protein